MKLNKFYLLVLILFCLIFISCANQNIINIADMANNNESKIKLINIVDNMDNGLESELIQNLYTEYIKNVCEWTNSKYIEIWYYETDLNDNGYNDILTIVRSPLHSGSEGDSFDIWINDGNNEYSQVSSLVARILANDSSYTNGEVYILDKKTNGFKDINIRNEDINIILTYQNNKYTFNN